MVINRTSGKGIFGSPTGHFNAFVNDGDSISLSVKGYPIINLVINADSNCQFLINYFIEGKVQDIEKVVVRPLKSLQQIKEERAALAMRETKRVTGLEAFQSPITALYQTFSKREKAKRWIAEQEYKDDQVRIVKELLRTYVAFDIIDLTDDEFEDFIYFLNLDEMFLKTASEMELITFIQDKFDHYLNVTH